MNLLDFQKVTESFESYFFGKLTEIAKAQDALVRAKARYDAVASNLEELMEKKKEQQARVIMDAFIKSGKSYEEIMNFLNVDGK